MVEKQGSCHGEHHPSHDAGLSAGCGAGVVTSAQTARVFPSAERCPS